jgi:hypothetical protein
MKQSNTDKLDHTKRSRLVHLVIWCANIFLIHMGNIAAFYICKYQTEFDIFERSLTGINKITL